MDIIHKGSKKQYSIGDQVLVKVIAANKEASTVDFALIKKINAEDSNTKVLKRTK